MSNEKGRSPKIDLPLLKNDITGSEPNVKILDKLQKSKGEHKKSRTISSPSPNHNQHTDEFDLQYCILQGF